MHDAGMTLDQKYESVLINSGEVQVYVCCVEDGKLNVAINRDGRPDDLHIQANKDSIEVKVISPVVSIKKNAGEVKN